MPNTAGQQGCSERGRSTTRKNVPKSPTLPRMPDMIAQKLDKMKIKTLKLKTPEVSPFADEAFKRENIMSTEKRWLADECVS